MSARSKSDRHPSQVNADRQLTNGASISALQAERLGIYPDWPAWPLGASVTASWSWLLLQVEAGLLPDLPCRWCETVDPERSIIYWLDTRTRTRHLVIDHGARILTRPSPKRQPRRRLH
jgi:hypothetical protein